ncbi:phytanoyl-CoA dioxygenase family protein [Acidipila sp. EB88]|uniref:phytanoyl-CoA dioxygenase family protein n=1 Tax=Acidipila sp. EB88 TaxID=2305226 RepID=UPI000F5D73BB|nr:phytanoyl-CoA dioxygenase family protein [Acidipila sp. EB88]RRA49628.1 phytanoyl-CoA dioxygenase [Acidipila sp. EB88]
MQAFSAIESAHLTRETLRSQLAQDGYALIRQVLPKAAVRAVLSDVASVLYAAGWLESQADPLERIAKEGAACGDPDPAFKRTYQQVFNLEKLHALPHEPALRRVMDLLVDEQVLVHPKPIARLIFPNCERLVVRPHQDYEFMGGDPEFYTAWIALHDCPVEAGPLRILAGSHRFGIQYHEHGNLHVPEIPAERAAGDTWVGGQVNAGDVLIFHSLTVHAASPNLSQKLRLSLDCRFQDATRVLNPSNLVFAGQSGKSWGKTYSGWQSDALQFYWKRLPLRLKPTKAELEALAQTAGQDAAREKYARMASQLA